MFCMMGGGVSKRYRYFFHNQFVLSCTNLQFLHTIYFDEVGPTLSCTNSSTASSAIKMGGGGYLLLYSLSLSQLISLFSMFFIHMDVFWFFFSLCKLSANFTIYSASSLDDPGDNILITSASS